ncbi:MAG: hypothetical protein M1358_17590, partial [Chloroflexi bacterium]|nr:hypothetical protein [Chloroflexota bacterium]
MTATLSTTATVTPTPTATFTATPTFTASTDLTDAVDIDPDHGGLLRSADGEVTVEFPPGAVSRRIKTMHSKRPRPEAGNPLGLIRRFSLEAWSAADNAKVTRFAKPVTVTLHYTESLPSAYNPLSLKLDYFDEVAKTWVPLSTIVDVKARTVSATTNHFTEFALEGVLLFPIGLDRAQVGLYTGASTFEYPLDVPPGTNGLAPKLSLSYNSGGADSTSKAGAVPWVGLGWSLDLGSVRLVKKDEYTSPRYFLELNGLSDELMEVGTYGDSKTYKTKSDSFLQIRRDDVSPGSRWTITDTSGTVYKFGWTGFGGSNNSRQQYISWIDDCSHPPEWDKWNLDKVTDTSGNSMEISYVKDSGPICGYDMAAYPSVITYATTDAGGAKRKVTFTSSSKEHYCTMADVCETRKLDAVNMYVTVNGSEQLVRKYQFNYSLWDLDFQQWLILSGVTQYDYNGLSGQHLPSYSFNYTIADVNLECDSGTRTRKWLSSVANGYGGGVGYTYGEQWRSTPNCIYPQWSRQAVASRVISDGLGIANTWQYTYTGMLYGHNSTYNEDEFRGYAQVGVVDPTGAKTISFFLQNDIYKGRNYQTDVYDASGVLLHR